MINVIGQKKYRLLTKSFLVLLLHGQPPLEALSVGAERGGGAHFSATTATPARCRRLWREPGLDGVGAKRRLPLTAVRRAKC